MVGKLFKIFTFVLFASGAFAASDGASASIVISIDKTAQLMQVTVDGRPTYTWPVSTGRPGYSTPTGSFVTFRMELDYFSKEWDEAPMPYSIFFTTIGHAIHGSYETKRLGRPVSHGCVRISPENARVLFALVQAEGLPNTRVIVTGADPGVAKKGAPVALPGAEMADNSDIAWKPGMGSPGKPATPAKKKPPAYKRYYFDPSFPPP